ncbi:MAG: hypothetical protein ACOCRK_05195, partial [bacterium]
MEYNNYDHKNFDFSDDIIFVAVGPEGAIINGIQFLEGLHEIITKDRKLEITGQATKPRSGNLRHISFVPNQVDVTQIGSIVSTIKNYEGLSCVA